ncbi:hypothetical protein MMC25_003351 [Agyrium rufum]|nr:hypothetical protein [Agyrium rufum]
MANASSTQQLLYSPSIKDLQREYVGVNVDQLPTPCAILDRAIIKKNCDQLLAACRKLGTVELTRLQLGENGGARNIIISTVNEAIFVADYMQSLRKNGNINILYGVPIGPSQIKRLALLGKHLGPGSISLLVDHVSQLPGVSVFESYTGWPPQLFVKVDTGYGRAGVPPNTDTLRELELAILTAERAGEVILHGFYSHAGHSYNSKSASDRLTLLASEIRGLVSAADAMRMLDTHSSDDSLVQRCFCLSVGASPTATSIESILSPDSNDAAREEMSKFQETLRQLSKKDDIEIHAGVYPLLDMQQLDTSGLDRQKENLKVRGIDTSAHKIAITILAEVVSLYPEREPAEAMIAAGSLAIGREPRTTVSNNWATMTDWKAGLNQRQLGDGDYILARVSQEHGILQKAAHGKHMSLEIGQKVRLWPNHACIAGAGYGHYFVVDSSLPEQDVDTVQEVWERCNGW